jgi:hypothetical protein
MIEVGGAGLGHPVFGGQEDIGGGVPDGRSNRRYRDLAEVLQDGVPGEEENGRFLSGLLNRYQRISPRRICCPRPAHPPSRRGWLSPVGSRAGRPRPRLLRP